MKSVESKRFDLNRDTAARDAGSGVPLVAAGALITLVIVILFSFGVHAMEPPPVPVDLNKASLAELDALPGIGAKRARDIAAYREKSAFKRPSDLLRVRGIGRGIFLKLKPFLRVGPEPAPVTAKPAMATPKPAASVPAASGAAAAPRVAP